MPGIRNLRRRRSGSADINITPLMDMIFILLIFFMVTTSFVKESGVEVQRPTAKSAQTKEKANMVIGINEKGRVFIQGKPIDIRSVRSRMERYLMQTPKGSVVIAADKKSQTDELIQVLDACRLAGVENISVAAKTGED